MEKDENSRVHEAGTIGTVMLCLCYGRQANRAEHGCADTGLRTWGGCGLQLQLHEFLIGRMEKWDCASGLLSAMGFGCRCGVEKGTEGEWSGVEIGLRLHFFCACGWDKIVHIHLWSLRLISTAMCSMLPATVEVLRIIGCLLRAHLHCVKP